MRLDPTTARLFIKAYQDILSMVHSLAGIKNKEKGLERLVEARRRLFEEPALLDRALEALEEKGVTLDKAVVSAIRTLELGKWIYLKDLTHHSIFLHPDRVIGFGVVGLTQPIATILGRPGVLLEAGLMAFGDQILCDGLLGDILFLGHGFKTEYDQIYKELKAIGAFHQEPIAGAVFPPNWPRPSRLHARARAAGVEPATMTAAPENQRPIQPSLRPEPQKAPTPPKAPKAKDPYTEVIQLKVRLGDLEPPIWRRLQVPSTYTLTRLHKVLQAAFGWEGYHLHCFRIHGQEYAPRDQDNEPGTQDEDVSLKRVNLRLRTKFLYHYDFGDDWMHHLLVEGLLLLEGPVDLPRCIGGARACPPEDCGGEGGYQEMLRAFQDPRGPRRKEFKQWLGVEAWDAEALDLDQVNASIVRICHPNRAARTRRA